MTNPRRSAAAASSPSDAAAATACTCKFNYNLSTYITLICIWTCLKYLLVTSSPSQLYRSTDFDVHRNWLALARHLPLSRWYYDDVDGQTVHTLDYPPSFAYFEYLLSNKHNPIVNALLSHGVLDQRCLELLPDDDNEPSEACVQLQRMTVLLSDVVLYVAAWLASHAVHHPNPNHAQKAFVSAVLIVTNPGLLLLDHVHFQYNGMLLGVLLLSIGCLARGAAASVSVSEDTATPSASAKASATPSATATAFKCDLLGAFFYAFLLGMKHLYLLLGPLYFVYLLRHCCFVATCTPAITNDKNKIKTHANAMVPSFSLRRFLALAVVTGTTLVLPYVPILLATESGHRLDQLLQIFRRLFPYQRGLVHSYWAANVWAVYLFADKCIRIVVGRIGLAAVSASMMHLPDVPPSVCSVLLLIALLPAMIHAWKAATNILRGKLAVDQAASFFASAVVFSAFSGFMLSFHCHEKAILTAVIPLTLLAPQSKEKAQLFLRASTLGHFGILPLLYRPAELGLKTLAYLTYMALSVWVLKMTSCNDDESGSANTSKKLTNVWDRIGLLVLLFVYVFMEVLHPLFLSNAERLAFLPLLMTSISCAVGLIICWLISFRHFGDATLYTGMRCDDLLSTKED